MTTLPTQGDADPLGITVDELPEHARGLLLGELDEGEQLLWVDQPIPKRYMYRRTGLAILGLFCILNVGLRTIVSILGAVDGEIDFIDPGMVPTFLFLGAGLAMVTSPAWHYRQAKRMAYALTDSRAIVVNPSLVRGAVESYSAVDLIHLTWTSWYPERCGSIVFFDPHHTSSSEDGPWFGFKAIANVSRVKDLIKSVAAKRGAE